METVTRNIFHHLTQRGLISQKRFVDGGTVISMHRSRNRFILVKQRSGPSYFVKQALETEPMTRETVAREASMYQGALADERLAPLRALLPRFFDFDAHNTVLITELVESAETLSLCHQSLGHFPAALGRRLGASVESFHRIRFEPGMPQAAMFPQTPHWIFTLHKLPDVSSFRRSPACSTVVDLLLGAPGLGELLAALRTEWVCDTLINTDLKWENCLVAPRDKPLAERRLYIVDWELSDIGDAAWDVGSIFQSYLSAWIGSMPERVEIGVEDLVAQATVPLESLKPAIVAFWEGYTEHSAHVRTSGRVFLERCVRMMAARLLVTAFEFSTQSAQVDRRAVLMLQTALNVLDRPPEAMDTLLGLGAYYV